jgi:hypothetical protein
MLRLARPLASDADRGADRGAGGVRSRSRVRRWKTMSTTASTMGRKLGGSVTLGALEVRALALAGFVFFLTRGAKG